MNCSARKCVNGNVTITITQQAFEANKQAMYIQKKTLISKDK